MHSPFFPALSLTRQSQLIKILDKEIANVSSIRPINYGKYVAFVAIRWGFAEIQDGRLVATKKWSNRQNLNEYGQPKHLKTI